MESTAVQKIARVLKVLVAVTLAVNLLALLLVPVAVLAGGGDLLAGTGEYLDGLIHPGEDDILAAGFAAIFVSWVWVWGRLRSGLLCLFLLLCGGCTAVILRQGMRVLDAVLRGEPFSMGNAASLKRAAWCCFLISAAALGRLVWSLCAYRSWLPLVSYNALFIPVFAMAGLLCLVMSALFRQAAELKAENDLTI